MLTATESKVCALIERRASFLLDDLRLHVETPTGGGHRAGLDETRERFVGRLAALGASSELIAGDERPAWMTTEGEPLPTVLCRRRRSDAGASVLIAGHLDTVHDPDGPFKTLDIASDRKTAIGPGCVDMKGGLVIALAALEALEEAGEPVSWGVALNSDEETGSYFSERALRLAAGEHDWGIALEPALPGGVLALERGGSGQFLLETSGRSAHVGREFTKGVSAVTALARCLVAIGDMPAPDRGRIVNIGPIEGGVATNAVPDRARAWGNVRYPDESVSAELGAMLDALQTEPGAMPGVVVHRSFNRPAKPASDRTRQLAGVARSAAEALGQPMGFARTGGVCDGNILQDAGLPTIDTLGVRGGALHTTDEWIELASLVERCQLLAVTILRLARGCEAAPVTDELG